MVAFMVNRLLRGGFTHYFIQLSSSPLSAHGAPGLVINSFLAMPGSFTLPVSSVDSKDWWNLQHGNFMEALTTASRSLTWTIIVIWQQMEETQPRLWRSYVNKTKEGWADSSLSSRLAWSR